MRRILLHSVIAALALTAPSGLVAVAAAQAAAVQPAAAQPASPPSVPSMLPPPASGPDTSARDLLMAAQQALARNQTGTAREAMEEAETRLLDRSTQPGNAATPDASPDVTKISHALDRLGSGDVAGARRIVDAMLSGPDARAL